MNPPLLCILTPVYNASAFLPRTCGSFERIRPEFRSATQLVLVDDGSTDDSYAQLELFAHRARDTFHSVNVLAKPNGGAGSARNAGLKVSASTWIMFLDSDDELINDPNDAILAHADASCIGVPILIQPSEGRSRYFGVRCVPAGEHLSRLTASNPFYPCSIIFRRATMEQGFDESLPTLEDWSFWLNNPSIFSRMTVDNRKPVARVHVHGGNKSATIVRRGHYRSLISRAARERFAGSLNRTQRNNLKTQEDIGRIMEGGWPFRALCRWPVDPCLYLKLLTYFALRRHFWLIDVYGRMRRRRLKERDRV